MEVIDNLNKQDAVHLKEDKCICGHEKSFHDIDSTGRCIHGLTFSTKDITNPIVDNGCTCKKFTSHLKSAKSYEDGFYDGLKIGLEVAKDVCKREGYEFSFPDPESIRISKDEDRHKGEEVRE